MKDGKQICKQLKAIRHEIAEQNDIRLVQEECTHKGNCQGTCPRCEQEVRYLEQELSKRQRMGKAVSIVGLATGVSIAATLLSSCTQGEPVYMGETLPPDDWNDSTMVDSTTTDTVPAAEVLRLDDNE